MVPVSGVSWRRAILVFLVLCSLSSVAVGRIRGPDILVYKAVTSGLTNLQAVSGGSGGSPGLLGVEDQEVGPDRKNVDGTGGDENPRVGRIETEGNQIVSVDQSAERSNPQSEILSLEKSDPRSDHIEAKGRGKEKTVKESMLHISRKDVHAKTEAATTEDTPNTTVKNTTPAPPLQNSPEVENKTDQSPRANLSPPPSAPVQDGSTADGVKQTPRYGGTCENPVKAELQATGEDGKLDFTLPLENLGGNAQLDVTIKTPSAFAASPENLKLAKGESKPVAISVVDKEAAKLGARINISWGEGDCYVVVPADSFADTVAHPSYLSYLTAPGTAALVLGGILVFILILGIAGVWALFSWRAHARRHGDGDAKYQELEMSIPSAVLTKQEDEISPSADGWDEVWEDDDWQDTEAVRSSSTSLTLSAKGLNSRRANKDGWDSSWDD